MATPGATTPGPGRPAGLAGQPTGVARGAQLLDAITPGHEAALRHVRHIPARPGLTADWPTWADSALVSGYRNRGIHRPWRHQHDAADAAWSGRHVVVATSTGSGKSMAFWLPALSATRADAANQVLDPGRIESRHRRGTALYLSPTKALAADQVHALQGLLNDANITDVRAATCDGDTGPQERRWVREHADIVLTNPDFVHFSMLPGHRGWARVLRDLRFVIIDEGHAYRGVFGAHVALILRRLCRLSEHYRAEGGAPGPTFIIASATSTDPAASAARLTGVPATEFLAVTVDTSPQGRKAFALWEPEDPAGQVERLTGTPDDDPFALPGPPVPGSRPAVAADGAAPLRRRSAVAEAGDLLAGLVLAGARVLAFTRSRRGSESVALRAQDRLHVVAPELAGSVAAYRGGYLPEERRALEQALRSGRLNALATTNALELGVDIAGLDAVLIAGWPGTRVSLWQQAGRAGRAGGEGLVVFIAREDPLDTYLVNHPEAVFGAPLEATVFDPANPYVLAPQLCAAAQELPLRTADLGRFGDAEQVRHVLDQLVDRGALRQRPSGWYWTHHRPASAMTDLRGAGGAPVRVVESATGRVLGTVDAGSADGTVHDGALYVHQGRTYLVEHLDLADGVALVHHTVADYTTWSRTHTSITVPAEAIAGAPVMRHQDWGPVGWSYGMVNVTSQVVSFQRRRLPDLQVMGTQALDLPQRHLPTMAVWWTVPPEVLKHTGIDPGALPGALHAAEHASIGLLPLLATCDRWDLGGVSTALHPDTGAATVFVHDAYPGGAGFAERGFVMGATWLRATRDAIATCPCTGGCPACVQSPKCGNYNSPLDKTAAVVVLDAVLAHAP